VAYGQSLEEGLVTLKPETKFYQEVKQNFKNFHLTRIENISIPGVPDLLCYNKNHTFFTIELKVTKSKKIIFSPHQIAFHVKHPKNTFILVKPLAPRSKKLCDRNLMKLNFTKDLASCSLPPVACRLTLVARGLTPVACCLKSSAPEACRLPPGARNFYNL
jgi:hypothetical protein